MEYAYRPEAWQALYTALASATAALTGLLFVALSLNLRTIVKVPTYIARAREALGGLFGLLILSLLILIPGQDHRVLGSELFVGAFILELIGGRLQFQTLRKMAQEKRLVWVLRILLLHCGDLFGMIAGISLIAERFGGLFWLVPTIIIYILWSLNNTWLLMVQVARDEP